MKMKSLAVIFIIFLLVTLASGLTVFLTKEKSQPLLNQQANRITEPVAVVVNEPAQRSASSTKDKEIAKPAKNSLLNAKPQETVKPEAVKPPLEEKIKAIMLIDSDKYEVNIKPGSSVYDLMNLLKAENKIDFSGKNYSGLGFFVESINGLKNNPTGENWVYYINGRPAPVGVSNHLIKNNDIIEWTYEKKSF